MSLRRCHTGACFFDVSGIVPGRGEEGRMMCPWADGVTQTVKEASARRSYWPEFRRKVLDLVGAGWPIR